MIFWLVIFGIVTLIGIGVISLSFENDRMNVDFDKDPPPDLIIEVDITNTNINKNQLYAAKGVPEFWRYNGETLRIFKLNNGEYEECETSPLFSIVQKEDLYRFLAEAVEDEMEAMRNFQAFLKQKITDEDN